MNDRDNENVMGSKQVKLLMAIASLFLAAVMLAGSSYAWFTVSTAPEISKIKVTMSATKNFEIAIFDKDNYNNGEGPADITADDMAKAGTDKNKEFIYWGETVEFQDNQTIALEVPAVEEGGQIQTVKYSKSKRTAGLTPATLQEDNANCFEYYTYTPEGETTAKKCAAVFKVWLRTNTTGNVSCEVTDVQLTGGDQGLTADDMGIFVQLGKTGAKKSFAGTKGTKAEIGQLEGSKKGTLVYVTVFIKGDKLDAWAVREGATLPSVAFSLKFTNDKVPVNPSSPSTPAAGA